MTIARLRKSKEDELAEQEQRMLAERGRLLEAKQIELDKALENDALDAATIADLKASKVSVQEHQKAVQDTDPTPICHAYVTRTRHCRMLWMQRSGRCSPREKSF